METPIHHASILRTGLNPCLLPADPEEVAPFATEVWLTLGLIGAGAVLAMLYVWASLIRRETALHDLKSRIADLQKRRQELLKATAEEEIIEVGEAEPLPGSGAA
jgi:hypothetical protein